jgi:threonine dehydrogenase-like Zn-dependent dehydrogenase
MTRTLAQRPEDRRFPGHHGWELGGEIANNAEGTTMKAVTWHGKRDVRVDTVEDPKLREPTDAIIRITSTGICGSDLHLYEVLGAFMGEGDILGHEPMGVVEEVGTGVTNLKPGDRVVVPFNISCGHCFMCDRGLQSQCETTQVKDRGKGAALLGYTKLYGQVPGGQAEFLRVPQAHYGPIKVPDGPPDERFVYLSDVVPTAWQAVEYANIPDGGSVAVFGLGPIGQMSARIAKHRGAGKVIGVDLVPERLSRAAAHGATVLDTREHKDIADAIRQLTDGRGADSVIDAVGMEAHGAPMGKIAQDLVNLLPQPVAAKLTEKAGIDRLSVLYAAIDSVRRGGTISLSGVYGGMVDPMPMMDLFDKQIQLRMGQANVRHWLDDIMPLVSGDKDPLGVEGFATHKLPLKEAPHAYEMFQQKQDGAIKILLQPGL